MFGTYARRMRAPDYPWAPTPEQREAFCQEIVERWGGPVGIEERAPSMATDPAFREWWATYLRMGASPSAAVALTRMNAQIDIRAHPADRARAGAGPASHRRSLSEGGEGRYVASLIPGARFVELPGQDHLPFVGDQTQVLDAIESFLNGLHAPIESNRKLATILCVGPASERTAPPEGTAARKSSGPRRRALAAAMSKRAESRVYASSTAPRGQSGAAFAIAAARHAGLGGARGLHTGECDVMAGAASGLVSWDSPRGSPRSATTATYWCRARWSISSPDRACGSSIVASTSSPTACTPGTSSQSKRSGA